jgi:hypothetical protein
MKQLRANTVICTLAIISCTMHAMEQITFDGSYQTPKKEYTISLEGKLYTGNTEIVERNKVLKKFIEHIENLDKVVDEIQIVGLSKERYKDLRQTPLISSYEIYSPKLPSYYFTHGYYEAVEHANTLYVLGASAWSTYIAIVARHIKKEIEYFQQEETFFNDFEYIAPRMLWELIRRLVPTKYHHVFEQETYVVKTNNTRVHPLYTLSRGSNITIIATILNAGAYNTLLHTDSVKCPWQQALLIYLADTHGPLTISQQHLGIQKIYRTFSKTQKESLKDILF